MNVQNSEDQSLMKQVLRLNMEELAWAEKDSLVCLRKPVDTLLSDVMA